MTAQIPGLSKGVLPDAQDSHLLLAILDPANAREHWLRYVEGLGNAVPNEGESRLFAMVATHLRAQLSLVPLGQELTKALRRAQIQQVMLKRTRDLLAARLAEINIPAFWTKGTALSMSVYRPGEYRTSADVDVIIRWQDAPRLATAAQAWGWVTLQTPMSFRPEDAPLVSALSFALPDLAEADFSWSPRRTFSYDATLRDDLWQGHGGAGMRTAPASWLLLETLDHGLYSNPVSPIRWVIDGVLLVNRRGDDIDWPWVFDMARRYHMGATLQAGLPVLVQFGAQLPADAMEQARLIPVSDIERAEFNAKTANLPFTDVIALFRAYNLMLRANDAQFIAHHAAAKGINGLSLDLQVGIERRHAVLEGVITTDHVADGKDDSLATIKRATDAGFHALAHTLWSEAAVTWPDDEKIALGHASSAARVTRPEAARDLLAAVTRRFPRLVRAKLDLARAHLRLHDPRAALMQCNDVLAIEPKSMRALTLRAEAAQALRRNDDAIGDLRQVCAQNPAVADGWPRLADALLRLGRCQDVLDCCETALAKGHTMPSLRLTLARAEFRMGLTSQAAATFSGLGDGPEILLVRAAEATGALDAALAFDLAHRAIAQAPGEIGAYRMLADGMGDLMDTAQVWSVIDATPDSLKQTIPFQLSVYLPACMRSGRVDQARAIATNFDRPRLAVENGLPLVQFLWGDSQPEAAGARMTGLLRQHPRDVAVLATAIRLFGANDPDRRAKLKAEFAVRLTPLEHCQMLAKVPASMLDPAEVQAVTDWMENEGGAQTPRQKRDFALWRLA